MWTHCDCNLQCGAVVVPVVVPVPVASERGPRACSGRELSFAALPLPREPRHRHRGMLGMIPPQHGAAQLPSGHRRMCACLLQSFLITIPYCSQAQIIWGSAYKMYLLATCLLPSRPSGYCWTALPCTKAHKETRLCDDRHYTRLGRLHRN